MREEYGKDPAGGELADIARSGAREWERDMSAWESDAEMLRLRQRRLVNVLWEAMQRGDQITVTTGDITFTGRLAAARHDLALLDTPDRRVALNIGALSSIAFAPGGDGVTGERTYGSFQAYLGMLEVEGHRCRFIGEGFDVRGTVTVVADDHVLVDAEGGPGRWALTTRDVAAVIRRL